ncbi:hypothetical protein [Halorarum salinum]|uniref:Uncharacterized protein n=1 Tax=Halorarum salinum TaxID=2743089 RepID=A0A7D5Q854_9EURY|nr:hypothetical protein [Halobaculum salinum]QLG60596.1 hypothetical protein HUG12_02080 [Halobaculum salinum]
MGDKEVESCGRCAMSTVTEVLEDPADPYQGPRIELSEREARAVSPAAWLEGVTDRLDEWATKLTYGR